MRLCVLPSAYISEKIFEAKGFCTEKIRRYLWSLFTVIGTICKKKMFYVAEICSTKIISRRETRRNYIIFEAFPCKKKKLFFFLEQKNYYVFQCHVWWMMRAIVAISDTSSPWNVLTEQWKKKAYKGNLVIEFKSEIFRCV